MRDALLLTNEPATRAETIAEYQAMGGFAALREALTRRSPAWVLEQLETSRLRGRGGASFPTARKWALAAQTEAKQKYVVANGGEHEPGSSKDKHLVAFYPHKILEGLLLCAYATGASIAWVYLIEDMDTQIAATERAIAELEAEGLIGDNILGSEFSCKIRIHRAPPTYVAGEESAAIDSIEGGEGKPREKPPYPGQAGLHAMPTTVNNVETLAHVPGILRMGGEAFSEIGTEQSTGSLLFTLGEGVLRPGVYELPFGSTYRQLIQTCGGGLVEGRKLRALLPALSCAFLLPHQLDIPISYESLAELGTSPGCGGVHLWFEGEDVVAKTLEIADFFQREQCGQCPPCNMGTAQYLNILRAVSEGRPGDYQGAIHKVAAFIKGKGHCSLTSMATTPLLSALEVFAEDFETRIRG
mgnify:CR=1 FL=1